MSTIFHATGRRKTSVARVRLTPGTGQFTVNGRNFDEYFPTVALQNTLLQVFQESNQLNKFDVVATASGGGVTGQVGAIRLGIARALIKFDPALRPVIKPHGMLSRDPRAKERKKSGQPGARKRFQFSKR
jgi:small subunit ribosomal protein S9